MRLQIHLRGWRSQAACLLGLTALGLLLVLPVLPLAADDWLRFRGSNGTGEATGTPPPIAWSVDDGTNIAWKAPLPGRGVSSPIVVGDKVILTSSSGYRQDRLHVLAFDAAKGTLLWERRFWATGQTLCHPKMSIASSSPTSDGERIFALYSCNDVVCLDLDGNLLWLRGLTFDYENASNSVGMSASLVVSDGVVVAQIENDSNSFVAGLDASTGANRWKLERPRHVNWTSPTLWRAGSESRPDTLTDDTNGAAGALARDAVVLQSRQRISGHDPGTGKELWGFDAGLAVIPSSTAVGGLLLIPANGTTALRPGVGQVPEVAWTQKRLRLQTASLAVRDGFAYGVAGPILRCVDLASGDLVWQLRLEGPFSSSPVICGKYLYLFNEEGLGMVVGLEKENGEIEAKSELGETILATPAVAAGALYVRSDQHLWKIAVPAAEE